MNVIDINHTEEVENIPDDHNYSFQFPTSTNRKAPVKISKTSRLASSIKLSHELVKGINERNNLINSQNDFKENYCKQKIVYQNNKLKALNENIKLKKDILTTLKKIETKLDVFLSR